MHRKRIYLYVPKRVKKGILRGGVVDFLDHMSVPINSSYPVTRENAGVVPMWAHQAGVPIPVDSGAAEVLRRWDVPANIVEIPRYNRQVQERQSNDSSRVNFNALASIISKIVLDVLNGYSIRNEPTWKKVLRGTADIVSGATSNSLGKLLNPKVEQKESFLDKAAPVVSTVANAFMPGTGTMLNLGLKGLNWLGHKIIGKGGKARRKKDKKKKSIFIFNKDTRRYLGNRVSFKKDIEKAAGSAFGKKIKNPIWKKVVSSAFAAGIKTIAPAIGSGKLILGRKIKKSKLLKMGGTAADKAHMAWVRSFKKKKRGGKFKYVTVNNGKNLFGAGKRRRRRRKHKRGGSKLKVYQRHGLHYPTGGKYKHKRRRKHRHARGKGLVSSGILGVGDPRNPSGKFYF